MTDTTQTTTEKNTAAIDSSQAMYSSHTQHIQALVAETIQVDPELVPPDLGFGELPQWDSMGHMEVMLRLEEEFGIEINADTIAALISIPAICEYLNGRGHREEK